MKMGLLRCLFTLLMYPALFAATGLSWAGDPAPVPPSVVPTLFSEDADYIVHLDIDPDSSHYYPLNKGIEDLFSLDEGPTGFVGNPGGYHWGYLALGFKEPHFSGDRNVYIYDCNAGSGDCDNGMARFSAIWMPAPNYDGRSEACTRAVIGHELYHHVEYAYISPVFPSAGGCGGTWGKFVCEGQARAMQDKIYIDLDVDSSLSCTAGFVDEVNNYLGNPSQSLWASSYRGALFWTYLMEQYGNNSFEPTYGADFLVEFWEQAESQGDNVNVSADIQDSIDAYGDDTLLNAMNSFTLANYIKDLDITGTSQAFQDRYSYRDGNADEFDAVPISNSVSVTEGSPGVLNVTAPYWGARYDQFQLNACPTGSAIVLQLIPLPTFDPISQGILPNPLMYIGVVVERNNRVQLYYKKKAPAWSVNFSQPFDHYDRMTVITGGVHANTNLLLVGACTEDPPEPQLPLLNPLDPQTPGPPDIFTFGELEPVFPVPPEPELPPLTAFDPGLFQVSVGGLPARVLGGIPAGNGVRLQMRYPALAAGSYTVNVTLGGSTVSVPDALVIGDPAPDTLLLTDLSTTMALPPDDSKLAVAQFASAMFVDAMPEAGQLGLISFAGDDMEPNDDAMVRTQLGAIDDEQRGRLHVAIENLATGPGLFTSVGDGIDAALEELAMNGTANQARHLVMLLDGGENEAAFWSDIQQDVFDAGVTVHSVAFGGLADQALAQEIARTTGGQYQYASDAGTEADCQGLGRAYLSIADEIAGRRRFMDRSVTVGASQTITVGANQTNSGGHMPSANIKVFICPSDQDTSFSVDFTLFAPDGMPVRDGIDGNRIFENGNYVVVQLAHFEPGLWNLELTGDSALNQPVQVHLWGSEHNPARRKLGFYALPEVEDEVLRRGRADPRFPAIIATGDGLKLHASLTDGAGPLVGADVRAYLQRPTDGVVHELQLRDDNDEQEYFGPARGAYGGSFQGLSLGSPTGIPDDPMMAAAEGSIDLMLVAGQADGSGRGGNTVTVEEVTIVHEAFHILQQSGGPADRDNDGLPDRHEDRYFCLDGDTDDSLGDGDQDTLTNAAEFDLGTHPCASDTDGGGEQDGSEVRAQRNPLNAEDDALAGFGQFQILTTGFEHEPLNLFEPNALTLHYDTGVGVAYEHIVLRRGQSALPGVWQEEIFDPSLHPAYYFDRGLSVGQEYCYQFYGVDADGNEGAPSQIDCGIVRADPEPPLGHLELADSAGNTDQPVILGRLHNYNKNPATTEMSIGIDEHPDFAWIPYAETFDVDTGAMRGGEPRRLQVYAAMRDAEGAVSELYTDSIVVWPDGGLGDIAGSVQLAPGRGPDLSGILITALSPAGVSPASTDAAGNFQMDDLPPGDYDLEVSFQGYLPQLVEDVTVSTGQTTDLGVIALLPTSEILFVDGFE